MFVKTLFFVALVATVAIMPFVASSPLEADRIARSKAMHRFGARGMNNILKNHVVQVAAQMKAHAAGQTKTAVRATCDTYTSCSTCVADSACVWGITLGVVGPETNPTGFGTHGTCVSGTTAGPAAGADLFSIDIFNDGDGTTPAFWSSERVCAKPYRATSLNEAGGASAGIAMRAAVEVDSTFGYVVTLQEFQKIMQLPQAEQEDAIFTLVARMFTGIRMYTTIAMAHGGEDAADRAAFFMFFQAIDLGTFMKNIFTAMKAGNEEYDGLGDGAQSVAFLAFFDSINTYAYTAGAAGTGTAMVSIPVTGLTLAATDASTATVEIHKYTMSGNVGATGKQMNFNLACYLASDDWTHLTRTIGANAYECDITINNINTNNAANNNGAAFGVTLNVIVVSLDTNLAKSNAARATTGNVNVGNADFTILATASAGSSSSSTTTVNVITKADPTCASSTFLTAEYKAAVTKEFGGSVSPFCINYSFDASNVNYIFWDPAGAVDEKKATAAANAKARSSAAAIAPLIAAVLFAAMLAVFAL
eukprot:c52148_g1_i1.p2 GENE.c52148_g1_i1~~c52148_g1_i1.p2  ORF type:complete len:546 (+),score=150.62 c52148_g1_i1:36-1640(+)